MDILGIGPLELIFILVIMLIVLGPTDMVKAGRTLGRTLRSIYTSPTWKLIQNTSRGLRNLPTKLAREAGLEDLDVKKDLLQGTPVFDDIARDLAEFNLQRIAPPIDNDPGISAWTTPPASADKAEPAPAPEPDLPASESGES